MADQGERVLRTYGAARVIGTLLVLCFIVTFLAGTSTRVSGQQARTANHFGFISQEPQNVVAAFEAALNAHDPSAAVSLFADNAIVSDFSNIACIPGPPPFCGGSQVYTTKVQIRGWLEQLTVEDVQVNHRGSYQVEGGNVTWILEVYVSEYRRLGVAPLTANAQAIIEDGKIRSLTISLDQASTEKLALGYAAIQRAPYSVLAIGIGFGLFVLGLVFPAAAVYYISRVRSLFAVVPRLKKPWILLQAGVLSLFIAILLVGIRSSIDTSTSLLDTMQYSVVALAGFFILAAMILMKRVWFAGPDD
jgi:hypothetical protein